MHLAPKEQHRLTRFTVAGLARRRPGGRRLNVPEAIAPISDRQLLRLADVVEAVAGEFVTVTRNGATVGLPDHAAIEDEKQRVAPSAT